MSSQENERDDFWDLDKLVPQKKSVSSPFATVSQVSEHTVSGDSDSSSDKESRRLSFENMPQKSGTEETVFEYPSGGLIKRVTIKRRPDKYDFYGNFRKAALIYYDYKTPKCEFAPFYSYMPQYTQLNSQQKNYYFYWRDEVRRGKYIRCDYSYIYLFVYEILNLPDKIPAEEGIKLLCRLWKEYRKELPRIDAYFSVWIQDYCFVYNLPAPMSEIRDFVFDVISSSDFKEFYLSDQSAGGKDRTEAMVAYLSDYDWRKTKYAEGENAEIFRNHMIGAMGVLLGEMLSGSREESASAEILKRDAFPHSLCTHAVKCKLEIEYIPLAKDDDLRKAVTASVRYTENKLRAFLGVKSRLGIKDLPDIARRILDRYFDNIFEMERRRRERDCAPEYEKLYDAEDKVLSFADAEEIERSSWVTTARLVVDEELYDDADMPPEAPEAEKDVEEKQSEEATVSERHSAANNLGLSKEDISLISAILGDPSVNIPDDAFERINEAFAASELGDIILESLSEGYAIIEDYREDISAWLEALAT